MTDEEWLACDEPDSMVVFLKGQNLDRKLRLFSCACCRRIWSHLHLENSRRMVEIAERYADGVATRQQLNDAIDRAEDAAYGFIEGELERAAADAAVRTGKVWHMYISQAVVWVAARDNITATWDAEVYASERAAHRALLRDIFGNPFRPVAFAPEWRADTTTAIARQMYESRDFGAMPILADALQDAGCDNEAVLSHCRGEGSHVRGCWVVDLVLGKS